MGSFIQDNNFNFSLRISGRYSILEFIGKSEFTEVYKVKDRHAGRVAALKVLRKDAPPAQGLILKQEFFYLTQLLHRNIVKVFDFGLTSDSIPFFTMEFVPGVEIRRFFSGYTPQLVGVLIELLSALDAIHREGFVHCDIKPSNILVYEKDGTPQVKLLDLGFVERMSLVPKEGKGTLGYIAPEVFKGVDIDGRTDLYSLGLVFYETLTGIGPGEGLHLEEWLKRQYYSTFEPIRRFNPDVPEALENVVMRMISRERERRPANAGEVVEELVMAGLVSHQDPTVSEVFGNGHEKGQVSERRDLMAPVFVGRQGMVEGLKQLLAEAGGGNPRVVFISGERGVGKSRLLAEFKFFAQLEGATVFAFEPVALGARSQSLVELLISTLKIRGEDEKVVDLNAFEQSKFRLFEHLVQKLKTVSESHRLIHSLVLLVDDFELFDPLSLEFVRYLALSLERERIFLVVSGLREKRFLDLINELTAKPHCRHFEVEVLSEESVRQLVVSVVGEVDRIDELVRWLYEFGGGNPLTTMEIIYAMVKQGVLFRDGLKWRLSVEALGVFSTPRSVADLVRRRLDGLLPEDQELLEVGALMARPFTIECLRAVLNYPDRTLFQAVSRLKASGFLRSFYYRNNEAGQVRPGLILSSKILETAVTERIPAERRRQIHHRVALAMEMVYAGEQEERLIFDLAHQWIQSGDKERGYRYSLKAGDKAREWLLFDEARMFYESALMLAPDYVTARERLNLIERVGELRETTGRYVEAIDIYHQGMSMAVSTPELSCDKTYLARFLHRLGLVKQKLNSHSEALEFFHQALTLMPDTETVESVRLLADLGWSYCLTGRLNQAEEYITRALHKAERLRREFPKTANELIGLGLYYYAVLALTRSDFVLALQVAEHSLEVFRAIDEQFMISLLNQFLASLWLRRGDIQKARKCYLEVIRTQQRAGDVYYLLNSYHGLGLISFEQGDWDEAEDFFTKALRLAELMGNQNAAFNLNLQLGNLHFERGDWNRAKGHYEQGVKISEQAGDRIPIESRARLWLNIGWFYSVLGEFTIAEHYLQQVRNTVSGCEDPELKLYLLFVEARLELREERYERAKRSVIQLIEALRKCRDLKKTGMVWFIIGQYRHATRARAEFEAKRALAIFQSGPETSLEYAFALRLSAQSKCDSRKKEQAVIQFREGIEILRRLGAKYELGLTLLATAELFGTESLIVPPEFGIITGEQYEWVRANLQEALSIFKLVGARIEVERTERAIARLEQVLGVIQLKARERNEYLKVFYQLSELINSGIDRDDFLNQVLRMVLSVTRAERGIIFLFHRERLIPVALQDVENATIIDAEAISHSVVRKVRRRREPLISADALFDPRFNSANSVLLNKIRSLLCVPLIVEDRVIGTIYLDSRLTTHLFTEEDRNLMQSVGHLIAATIERSKVFRRWQQELAATGDESPVDSATGLFLGRSAAMREVLNLVDKIAPTDCTVLITGETGTGKGVIARLIHLRSQRKDNKFVAVNCGALPETLFESELFGHARGAFTGAIRDKAGIFETANGGTIFLDEITNTTPAIQAKLLQVLEEKIIRRLGETDSRLVDVRLICATNKDILEEIKAGRFREDLYYRINVVTINVPPLRERKQDIMPLANYFLRNSSLQLNKQVNEIDEEVAAVFQVYNWPGNVRELQNTIERAVIMTKNYRITLEDIGEPFTELKETLNQRPPTRRSLTKEEVIQALKQTGGNITHAAKLLTTHRRQVQRLIKRYNINPYDIWTQS